MTQNQGMEVTARALAIVRGLPGEPLLDVGCGEGAFLDGAGRGVGVDLRPPARAGLFRADAHALPFPDGSFGVVSSLLVMHYLRRPRLALAELRRALRPGGRLVLADRVGSEDPGLRERQEHIERLRNAGLERLFTGTQLSESLESAGFRILSRESLELRTRIEDWCRGSSAVRAALEGAPSDLEGLRRDVDGGLSLRVELFSAQAA